MRGDMFWNKSAGGASGQHAALSPLLSLPMLATVPPAAPFFAGEKVAISRDFCPFVASRKCHAVSWALGRSAPMTASVRTSLLRRTGLDPPPAPEADPAAADVSPLQRFAVGALAALHILRGLCFLAYPASGISPLELPRDGATSLLSALLGVRDALLGGLLATADSRTGSGEVHRALAASLVSDAADTFILIFAAACAWQRSSPIGGIGVVAVMAIVEHLTLWSMGIDEAAGPGAVAAYQARLQAREDKKLRLDMWLADMRRTEELRQPPREL